MGLIRALRGRRAAAGRHPGSDSRQVEAERELFGIVQAHLRAHGPRDPRLLESRVRWAQSLIPLNRLEECETEIRETVRHCLRPLGPEHQLTATARITLVTVLYTSGQYAEAEVEARDLAASRAHIPGDKQRLLARSHAALAASTQGRHAEALAEQDDLLPELAREFGAKHPWTVKTRSDRSQTLGYLGRYAEAEAEGRAVADIADRVEGPMAPLLQLAARNGLVFALNGLGRHTEAETTAREAIGHATDTVGTDDRFALVLRFGLARSLNGQQRYDEALAEIRAARETHLRIPGGRHSEAGAIEIGTGAALLGLGRREEAGAEARRALAACESALGPTHHRTKEARDLLAATTAGTET